MEQKRIKEIEEKRDRDLEELSKKSVRLNFFVLRKDLTVKLQYEKRSEANLMISIIAGD